MLRAACALLLVAESDLYGGKCGGVKMLASDHSCLFINE